MKRILAIIILLQLSEISFSQMNESIKEWPTTSGLLFMAGDFNGDGNIESVRFRTESQTTGKEIATVSFKDSLSLYRGFCDSFPQIVIYEENQKLKEFILTDSCWYFNVQSAVNLGDLNGDGGDELLVVLYGLFYDIPNTFQIYSYSNGWNEVGRHPIYHIPEFNVCFDIELLIEMDENPQYISQDGSYKDLIKSY